MSDQPPKLTQLNLLVDDMRASLDFGFSLPSRAAVDASCAELTAAGYEGRQPPFDAFWGARYAIVADPGSWTCSPPAPSSGRGRRNRNSQRTAPG
jgi:uncharacterized glyoxalase superfamily protein PhnB